MKIAFVQSPAMLQSTFSRKALDRLNALGQLAFNEVDASAEQVRKTINGADIAVTSWGNERVFTEDVLNEAPELKLIVHAGGTVKPIVNDMIWRRGIRVTASPKPLGKGVAETALGFTISAIKDYYNLSAVMHEGGWSRGAERKSEDLFDVTIGVVGAGWAGSHYIRLLQNFDVEVLLFDPFISAEKAVALGACKVELEELLKRSDVVSIHAPSIPETDHMFNAGTLSLMKKDAILINTARGTIINEKDLYAHMAAGNLKYACLDVFDPEPPAADHPLRSLPNVILTPHIAGLSGKGKYRIGLHVADEIERFLRGEPLDCEVTEKIMGRIGKP